MRTKPCLTSADGHKMMAACKAEAEKNNWKVSIAIVDDAGALLLLERMDGAGPTTPEVAHGKARTAALTKQPSKVWEERVKERPAFLNFPAGLAIWGGFRSCTPAANRNRGSAATGCVAMVAAEEYDHYASCLIQFPRKFFKKSSEHSAGRRRVCRARMPSAS